MIYGILIILALELNQPNSEICSTDYFEPIPEMCDSKFNRKKEWFEK